jgi:hypothetical protein
VVTKRDAAWIAEAILTAHLDHDLIAAQQKRWVLAHASIEKATHDLERVYERYIRREPIHQAA